MRDAYIYNNKVIRSAYEADICVHPVLVCNGNVGYAGIVQRILRNSIDCSLSSGQLLSLRVLIVGNRSIQ